jgi:predicted RNA-binding protein associated with RNAse of E/G family
VQLLQVPRPKILILIENLKMGGIHLMSKIKFTAEEFINKYQHVDIVRVMQPQDASALIDDVCDKVVSFCRSESPSFDEDNLSDWKIGELKRAQMEHALTVLTFGRDEPLNENTKSILRRAGFLYKGLR